MSDHAATVRENIVCRVHRMPDCSPLLNGCSRVNNSHDALDALEAHGEKGWELASLQAAQFDSLEADLADKAEIVRFLEGDLADVRGALADVLEYAQLDDPWGRDKDEYRRRLAAARTALAWDDA